MDQEIEIISSETRKDKIKNFFISNKNKLISTLILLLLILFTFFFYQDYKKEHKEGLANKYSAAVIEYESGEKSKIASLLKGIIDEKDKTYSPLAFYFLLDNDLITSKKEINKYFDIIINEIGLDRENKIHLS